MHLHKLRLINFKNYERADLTFSAAVNVLVGRNGSGKTNLLDAIYYLSFTKSAFYSDQFSVRHGESFFSIKGTFVKNEREADVFCSVQGGKKTFREEDKDYQKLSDHIGRYPVVMIVPDDTDLVREGGENRRRFFDGMLSQLDPRYLDDLIHYNHALRQRNGLLKMFASGTSVDHVALDSYDRLLIEKGDRLFEKRRALAAEFLPVFQKYYGFIVEAETAGLEYRSGLSGTSFADGLLAARNRDMLLQRTTFGVHRDDFYFTLGRGDLKRLGSQGQQKSFVIALKFAQFEIVTRHFGFKPILLLDDIFDKLDDFRIQKLLELIQNESVGQLFITDARPDRTATLLRSIHASPRIFNIESGVVEQSVDLSY